ncbi:universal stress protein UspE [Salinisphaera sp. PC39]|uniref:universal stress protein n=1 Tax=Salinisphaera sp. PC39 TaxID=1304156 RepID=UPI0033423E68
MLLTQRILYVAAFDAIEPAVTAQVAELSKALTATVHVMTTAGPRYQLWRVGSDAEASARARIEDVAERLRGLRARVGETLVVKGNLATAAMEAAPRMEAEYIVIGAGESAAEDPAYVRTSARTLARSARENVWICKPEAEPALQHVLCTFDASRGSADGIRVSTDLCRQFNARLQLMSVLHPPPAGMLGGTDVERDEAEQAARRALHDQRLAFLEGFNFDGVKLARNLVWADRASPAILAEADKHRDGLLVLGVSGQRRFQSMMLGNTAEKVLDACPSSMLFVK